jgi:hypothetical protein
MELRPMRGGMSISRDEWLTALGEAAIPKDDPTAITVSEMAQMLGVGRMAAYRRLLTLVDQGKATTTQKQVTFPSGLTKRVAAYKLVKAKKK